MRQKTRTKSVKRKARTKPNAAAPASLAETWAADLVLAFERELAKAQERSIYVIDVKVGDFPSGADMLERPRGQWPELVVAVAARLDGLRKEARRDGVSKDQFISTYIRPLNALTLLADRLLKPRLAFDQVKFAAVVDIASGNLGLVAQQGRALGWNHVVPRTLLVKQAEHVAGDGPVPEPLASALKRLRDALQSRSRNPELQQRLDQLLQRR